MTCLKMLRIFDNHIPYIIQHCNVDLKKKKKQMQTLAASTNAQLQNTGGNGHITLHGQLMFRKLFSPGCHCHV